MRCAIILILTVVLVLAAIPSVISASNQEPGISIKLKMASFDPLATGEYRIAGTNITSYPPSDTGAYIVQFNGPVREEWKQQLENFGTVHGYIPEYAFIVEMNGTSAQDIANLDSVRWVGVYRPAYKMSPSLTGITDDFVFIDILLFDDDPGPVISKVEGLGGIAASSSLGRIFASINPSNIPQIAGLNSVRWIEKHNFFRTYNNIASGIINASVISTTYGMNGSGQIVAVADTGLDIGEDNASMHYDFQGRIENITSWPIDSYWDSYINNPGADDGAADLDSGHGTHVAGSVLGDGNQSSGTIRGTAYSARPMFQAVEQYVDWKSPYDIFFPDGYYLFGIPSDLTLLFQQAYDNDARIHTNSWGASAYGNYTSDANVTDTFVWNNKDMVILFAAGNDGIDSDSDGVVDYDSIGSPATAKNVITVGASENDRPTFSDTYGEKWPFYFPADPIYSDKIADDSDGMVAFSSRGPTDDNRIKPDVVAPGTYVLSTRSSVAPAGGLWGDFNAYYRYSGGTSMSTPLTAGAVALIRQYYVENQSYTPNASLIKATLINGAYDMPGQYTPDETGQIPNNNEGWGRVDLKESLFPESPRVLEFSDSEYALSTGGNHAYYYEIKDTSVQLKMTLVWTDYPGDPASSVALVNDLDLVVVSPSGTEYYGNDFSAPYNDTKDDRNNVEQVRVGTPETGVYTVTVKAVNVPQGPQDFSLVISGGFLATPPSITIHSPENITYYSPTIQLNVSANEDISTWIYDLNSAGNQTFTPNTTITAADGPNTLTVYANDTSDNWNSSTVSFTVSLPVHTSSGYNFSTIQEAIDNSTTGTTITVDATTLTENVDVNKPVNLIGAGAGLTTVQAANSNDHVFEVTANSVNISGFTLMGATGGGKAGIYLNANYGSISSNTIKENERGVYLYNSNNNNLSYNNLSYNEDTGIELYSSNNSMIIWNNASGNNYYGIHVDLSTNNTISNNTVRSNNNSGIWIRTSSDHLVKGNIISNNSIGLELSSSSTTNVITDNEFRDNNQEGISVIQSSTNNTIYHNNFINNTNQSYDNSNNTWDSSSYSSGGNYWSDWTSPDKNKDGIVDQAYNITGGSSQDRYPVTSENGWLNISPTLVVDASSPACLSVASYHSSIQSAVDANTGTSRIYVCDGDYTENIDVNSSVELIGAGTDVVTVNASNSSNHVFNVTANWVNISGFTVTGANGGGKAGIYINGANKLNISDNNASDNRYGIYLESSSDNTLTNNTLYSNDWDFYSINSSGNTLISNHFTNTTASFTYSGDIAVNSSSSPGSDPGGGYQNISKYLDITNTSSNAWLYLNISYTNQDLGGVTPSTLKMYRHNGTEWENVSGPNGVDTSNNYVYANLTNFSVFSPMGIDITPPNITITSPESKTYTTSSVSLTFSVQDPAGINWTGYSLDSGNITNSTNTTLTGLSNSQHNVTVYANDTHGNMGSKTVLFTVSVSAPQKQSSGGGGGGGGQAACIREGFQEMSADMMNCIINKLNLRYKKFYDVPITAAATYIQNSDKTLDYPAPTYTSTRETLSKGITAIEGDNIDIYSLASENTLKKLSYADSIIVARGDLEADSIAAVAYAKANNMPILLTKPDELLPITRNTIKKLGPKMVTIVGGSVAVSGDVEAELKKISTVKTVNRIAGADRSETAVEIAKGIKAPDMIVIADGYGTKLEAVFIANAYKAPIVYVTGDEVPEVTKDYLKANRFNTNYRPMKVVFVKISDKAKDEIKDTMYPTG